MTRPKPLTMLDYGQAQINAIGARYADDMVLQYTKALKEHEKMRVGNIFDAYPNLDQTMASLDSHAISLDGDVDKNVTRASFKDAWKAFLGHWDDENSYGNRQIASAGPLSMLQTRKRQLGAVIESYVKQYNDWVDAYKRETGSDPTLGKVELVPPSAHPQADPSPDAEWFKLSNGTVVMLTLGGVSLLALGYFLVKRGVMANPYVMLARAVTSGDPATVDLVEVK